MERQGARTTLTQAPPAQAVVVSIEQAATRIRAWAESPWIVAGFALLAGAVLLAMFVRTMQSPIGDTEAYYHAASKVRDGGGLYDRALIRRDEKLAMFLRPAEEAAAGIAYVYPPAFAVALVPLTFVSLGAATSIWIAFSFVCLVASAWVLSGLLITAKPIPRLAATAIVGAALALFQPIRASLISQNADVIILLPLALSVSAFASRRQGWAGAWLALAVIIKPFLGFLVLFYLWKRAYRAALVACALSAALLIAPLSFLGVNELFDFIAAAQYWSSPTWAVNPLNQSPYGLALRLFTANPYTVPIVEAPLLATLVRFAVVVATLIALALIVRRSPARTKAEVGLEYGLVLTATLFVSPLSEDMHYTFLAVAFVAAASVLWRAQPLDLFPLTLGAALAIVYVYLSLPTLRTIAAAHYAFFDAPVGGWKPLLTGVHVYGLCAFAMLIFLVIRWYRRESHVGGP